MIDSTSISGLRDLLSAPKNCVIVTHRSPDADALGSSLGWKHYLEKKGHVVSFVSPTHYTSNLAWIKGSRSTIDYENEKHRPMALERIANADIIFCLDFNALSRLEQLGEAISASKATKVMIDHHREPEQFAAISISDIQYAATAEMIYDIIELMGDTDLIDATIAENLYSGLVGDTGFFQFPNTTPNVHKVAGSLIAKGVLPDYVSDKVNNIFDERRLRYFGYILLEKLKVVKSGKVAYISVPQSDARRFNLQLGDNEGLVNYPFKIEGVMVTALFSEEGDKVKISLRSKADIDVSSFSRKYFEGGGHKNAAGGRTFIGMEETEKKFLSLVDELL